MPKFALSFHFCISRHVRTSTRRIALLSTLRRVLFIISSPAIEDVVKGLGSWGIPWKSVGWIRQTAGADATGHWIIKFGTVTFHSGRHVHIRYVRSFWNRGHCAAQIGTSLIRNLCSRSLLHGLWRRMRSCNTRSRRFRRNFALEIWSVERAPVCVPLFHAL